MDSARARHWAGVSLFLVSVCSSGGLRPASVQDSRGNSRGDWRVFLPGGEERELVIQKCFGCHDLDRVVKARGDYDQWVDMTTTMITEGADIGYDDLVKIARYLSEHFDPAKPPLRTPIDLRKAALDEIRLVPALAELAAAIIKQREDGKLGSFDDLEKVASLTKEELTKLKPFLQLN